MNAPTATNAPPVASSRRSIWLAGTLLVLAGLAVYANSFKVPFIFDDVPAIVENTTIRQLWPPWIPLSPPHDSGLPVSGRPLVNFSLALNYAAGGTAVGGYHALNLALHLLAGLTLLGVVRRTLLQPVLRARFGAEALPLALAVAVLWIVHPLQTEAVTYVVQRAESLVSLFYLLTLYCFTRSTECNPLGYTSRDGYSRAWSISAVATCLLGMASKEVMVTAPLIVLLYDRTFVAGSFRDAWHRRWRFYVSLAATWLLLAWLMAGTGNRGGTAGFGLGITWWAYALTQVRSIMHYLRLAFWPHPLVFDYGGAVLASGWAEIAPYAAILGALLAGTVVALRRWPVIGLAGAWFFAILAPTSSVVPVADTMFEHRMYLPLVAVVALAVLGGFALAGRRSLIVCAGLAVGLGWATVRRNDDYRSELALWSDTVAKRPENVRAHYTLGTVLFALGRADEAIGEYETALRLKPDSAEAHNDLGNALTRLGRAGEAVPHYEAALRLAPQSADAHNNLGNALRRLGRLDEARMHYEAALRARPNSADAHNNLGNLLAQRGEFAAAARHYEAALQARPDLADAQANLGNVLAQAGRPAEALPHYEAALQLRPDFADAHFNLATALALLRRWPEAITHYEAGLRLRPDNALAKENLARLRAMQAEETGQR
jgi:tetratricopeptide (TPR) repeat protein